MDLNQRDYEVAWWLETAGHRIELLKEGVGLKAKLLTARQDPKAALYNGLYLPIMEHDGNLPQHMNFAGLCAELDVNPMMIDEQLLQIMNAMNSQIGTKVAVDILRLPTREVRRLIEKKILPATKQGASAWVIEYIDVLRLAVKRLPAS
jgi:hypothetical protein